MGTKDGVEVPRFVHSFEWSSKAKISYLKDELFIKKKVIWLKIPVAVSILMAILKTVHELSEEVSGNSFFKSSSHSDEIVKFTSLSELKDDVVDLLPGVFFVIVISSIFDRLNNIGVVKL